VISLCQQIEPEKNEKIQTTEVSQVNPVSIVKIISFNKYFKKNQILEKKM